MNVLMICAADVWSMGEGKGAPTIYHTLKAFNDVGHTIYLVLPRASGGDGALGADVEGLAAFPRVRFRRVAWPRPWGRRRGSRSLFSRAWGKLQLAMIFPLVAAWEGRRILKQEKIDVLYGYEVQGVLAASLLRLFKRVPLVARFQGSVLDPAFRNPLHLVRKLDHVIALRAPANLYIMTDDGTMGDVTLTRLNPRSKQRLRFWRNGIDLERFQPTSREKAAGAKMSIGFPAGTAMVVSTSRLVRWKRLDRAIRAWPRVMEKRPDATLVLAGDGDERPQLEEMVSTLGLQNNVLFTGALRQDEVTKYLRAADVLLSVNDLSNAGNPLMEAIVCGKAIVTLNNGSTARLIEDGVTGILLEPDDDEALAAAIVRLIEDPNLRHRLGRQARQFALENFRTWDERMAEEVQAVLELLPQPTGTKKPA